MTKETKRKLVCLADEIEDYATLCWRAGDLAEAEKHDKWVKEIREIIGEKNE